MELVLALGLAAVCLLLLYYVVRSAVRDGTLDAHRSLEREAQRERMRSELERSRLVGGDEPPPGG